MPQPYSPPGRLRRALRLGLSFLGLFLPRRMELVEISRPSRVAYLALTQPAAANHEDTP